MTHASQDRPQPGHCTPLAPGIRRVLAPNPSPMTFWGTNSYIVGTGTVAIIDPGPDDIGHLRALLDALDPGEAVAAILVTHSHRDHSPLARRLSAETGAPIHAFGDSLAGKDPEIAALADIGGGEGVDPGFRPDHCLTDGETMSVGDVNLTALWTPGHMGNHLCFAMGDVVFSGDHVMGWATSMVSPPDGDLGAFMASLQALSARSDRVFYPGHGAPVETPQARVRDLIAHRRMREAQILTALSAAPGSAADLAARIYTDVAPALLPAAARNVLAHLIDLDRRGLATRDTTLSQTTVFHPR
ncbi:MBL fold metallo-hydrolase [Actibacterium ureilyticum]|uniref:MBL fold metallo-hydrolase n=1 Tax=Actibacterium ureilyticum TaxID=1590614 RepID=UPI000BAAA250|nr:MBL fold metallo-hydrolase [Actibacterium ureilyticum]